MKVNRHIKIILFTVGLFSLIYWTVQVLSGSIVFERIFQIGVLWAGVADAYKYTRLRQKIERTGSSRDVSRMFSLIAILCDIIFVTYTLIIKDPFLIFVRGVALYTTIDLYYHIYLYYPYKTRGLPNFKRPALLKFIWNTLLPNDKRPRL